MEAKPNTTDKIILPKNLQREMIKFFTQASIKNASKKDKEKQQTPEKPNKGC